MSGRVTELSRYRARRDGVEAWVTKQELAHYLAFSTRWVEMRVQEGMPYRRLGGRMRFQITAVEGWIASRPERPVATHVEAS